VRLRLRSLAVAALALLVSALATPPAPAQSQSLTKLRVATTPIDIGAEVLWARDLGLFKKAGLDVDVQLIGNGAAIASAISGGALDIAQGNLVTLATAHERGLPFVLVAPAGMYNAASPTTQMIVAQNSPIKSAKDLNGKTIAVSGLQNITQVGAYEWIAQNGGDPNTINWIEVPFSQMCSAVTAGRVVAAVVAEPTLSEETAKQGCKAFAPVYDAIGKQFLIGAWFTTSSWAKAHPDLVKRFADVIEETAKWANTHHAESAQILSKYTKVPIAPNIKRASFAERLQPSDVQPIIDATAKAKVLKSAFPAQQLIAAS
jgi:NitT/TauT family transport system substrate-binding protein